MSGPHHDSDLPEVIHTGGTVLLAPHVLEEAVAELADLDLDPREGDFGAFEDEGLIAEGGMGEVHLAREQVLNRSVAMKILKAEVARRPGAVARFLAEAQATAQLQHPGIVPVHQLGRLPDGRIYFTMRRIQGTTLARLIREVHLKLRSVSSWNLHRLISSFLSVCEAVAYAHSRGVVHRDLKPDNVMLAEHGQVLVVDWGLAKVLGQADHLSPYHLQPEGMRLEPVTTSGNADHLDTLVGQIAGTPSFMSPEQARGEVDRIDSRTDVYSLGAILFTILSGQRPYHQFPNESVIEAVVSGPPTFKAGPLFGEPEDLVRIMETSMARDPEERFPNAGVLAEEIRLWLEGARRRERAQALVDSARQMLPQVDQLRTRARFMREEAAESLAGIPSWAPEEAKSMAWKLRSDADETEMRADLLDVEAEQLLQRALAHDPDQIEAHEVLAERFRILHAQAERDRRLRTMRRAEALLRGHLAHLPRDSAARRRHESWLRGSARVSLVTDPPGARVDLFRFVPRNGRLALEPNGTIGQTPLEEVIVPVGSTLLKVQPPDPKAAPILLPMLVEREQHLEQRGPDGKPVTLRLPESDELGPDEVLISAGWTLRGGDANAIGSATRERVWVDAFVMERHPVTNSRYIAFLDHLVSTGQEELALDCTPREKGGTVGERGAAIYGRDGEGRFVLRADADGDLWKPDWPVLMVDWHSAQAYARWRSEQTGQEWRLPSDLEWGKAARGVDGRFYPWGDDFDPSWCCMRDSHPGGPSPSVVTAFPADESPYGVRGMGGNARDWCEDADANGRHYNRGGNWMGSAREARCADRHAHAPNHRGGEISFRLVRSWA